MTHPRHTTSHIAAKSLCVLMLAFGLLVYGARGIADGFGATPPDAQSRILDLVLLVVPAISLAAVYLAGGRRVSGPIVMGLCSAVTFGAGIYAIAYDSVLLWVLFVALGTSLAVAAHESRKNP